MFDVTQPNLKTVTTMRGCRGGGVADVVTEAIMNVSIVTQTCAECREAAQSPAEECGKSVLY